MKIATDYLEIFNTYCQTLRADGWLITSLELPGAGLPYLLAKKDGFESHLIAIPNFTSPTASQGSDSDHNAYHIDNPSDNSA